MILVNKTYSEISPESADDGELSDMGMIFENVEYTFCELVRLMRQHTCASCSPARGDTFEWYSTGFEINDYRTCVEREVAIHYSRDNHPRSAKYWRLAAIAAGIVERGCRGS